MATGKLTKRAVDSILPGPRDVVVWDTDLRGFGLKITPRGFKSYIVQYRMGGRGHPTKRYTLGAHGSPWTPENARKRAHDLLVDVRHGIDPSAAEQQKQRSDLELAFNRYVQAFIEGYAKREQPRSWKQAQQCLEKHAIPDLGSRPLPSVGRRDVARLVERVSAEQPATARYLHAILRKLFRWAVARGDLSTSPMAEMRAPRPVAARDRVLGDQEIRAIWEATATLGFPFGPMFRILILTGQRREEVGGMAWAELDLENRTWTIPAERSKNGSANVVPLSELAIAELDRLAELKSSEFVFSTTGCTPPSGWSKAKRRLDQLLESRQSVSITKPWRTHDIRRTVATGLQRLGVRFEVTEAILNHLSGARSGVAGVYQRHNWASEKRAALNAWCRALEKLINGDEIEASNILSISRASA